MVRNARYTAAYFVILAMMLRALVPAGWMPNPAGTAGAFFTICTIDGIHRIAPPQKSGEHAPAPAHDNSVCPFAATAHFAPPAQAPALTPRQTEATPARFAASSSSFVSTVRDWNRAPRAPPSNS